MKLGEPQPAVPANGYLTGIVVAIALWGCASAPHEPTAGTPVNPSECGLPLARMVLPARQRVPECARNWDSGCGAMVHILLLSDDAADWRAARHIDVDQCARSNDEACEDLAYRITDICPFAERLGAFEAQVERGCANGSAWACVIAAEPRASQKCQKGTSPALRRACELGLDCACHPSDPSSPIRSCFAARARRER